MTRIVTKATAIQFINGKCHIKKCRKTALSGYYACVSRDLLLMPSGVDTHTHTHTHVNIPTFADKETRRVRACGLCTPDLKIYSRCLICILKFKHAEFKVSYFTIVLSA